MTQKSTDDDQGYGLANRDSVITVTARLTNQTHDVLKILLDASCRKLQGVLLEFPNMLPPTFVPILNNLQDIKRLSRLRFSQWLLPGLHNGVPAQQVFQHIPPPVYARRSGFKFPLAVILSDEALVSHSDFGIEATASCSDIALVEEIATKTELDKGQCRALVAALTRELAFIQGPLGTGKSYLGLQIMRVLLAIKEQAALGPVIVV